jgi:hypothetical protein
MGWATFWAIFANFSRHPACRLGNDPWSGKNSKSCNCAEISLFWSILLFFVIDQKIFLSPFYAFKIVIQFKDFLFFKERLTLCFKLASAKVLLSARTNFYWTYVRICGHEKLVSCQYLLSFANYYLICL